MTAKRFEFREINEPPILPKCYDTEKQEYANLFECVGWLNELHEEKEDMQGEIDHCHRIIETLVAQKGVTDYMDLLNLCDKDILIENGWEIWEEEE